jgi:hypothetical protein
MRQNDEKEIETFLELVTRIRNFQILAKLSDRDIRNFLLNYVGYDIQTNDEEEIRDFVREIHKLFLRITAEKCKR